jgi:peptidoglycan hydrolase-like protein with peptidoglycan-binding domain
MRMHRASGLVLAILVAAALGVIEPAARAQSGQTSNSTTPKHRATTTHRGKSAHRSRVRERGQKAPAADRISEIQTALAKDGSFAGTPNGKWDATTVDAMKKFQESHGLTPTGKLDAKTLQKLGLGSQTAGVAPPMPPVSSSALTPQASGASVPRRQ